MKQTIARRHYEASDRLCDAIRLFFCDLFDVKRLEELHKHKKLDRLKAGTDQASPFHQAIYKEFDKDIDSDIVIAYRKLCIEWLDELKHSYEDEWAVQRYPSVRIHMPLNISVFEFHRDSDYYHQLGEINHFLSVTASQRSAALHVEEHLGWNDFKPLELKEGESAVLNTSIYKHGDMINREGYTRVSIDFRAIPLYLLKDPGAKVSLSKKKTMDDTDYFIREKEICSLR